MTKTPKYEPTKNYVTPYYILKLHALLGSNVAVSAAIKISDAEVSRIVGGSHTCREGYELLAEYVYRDMTQTKKPETPKPSVTVVTATKQQQDALIPFLNALKIKYMEVSNIAE